MGLAKKDKTGIFLTYAGVLLFCKKEMFPHSLLHSDVTLRDEGRDVTKSIRGSVLEAYFAIREQLDPYLGVWDDPTNRDNRGAARKFFDYPDVAITEALVNFFVHRDYQSEDIGYITIFPNRIEFENPGASQYPVEKLLTYEKPLHPKNRRNPRLLQVLHDTGLNQREGRGIYRIREELNLNESYLSDGKLGLVIENDLERDRFVLTIYKKIRPVAQELADSIGFIPPVRTEIYIHRGKVEDEVINFIRKGGKGAIVGLHAPGGLGKTELAKQVAQQLRDEFEILWIDVGAKKPYQLASELLTKCGIQIQPNDSYERLVHDLQSTYKAHRFLVILLNFDKIMIQP
ncbi:MAG: hypothetical protein HND47_05335 [Chloroflexi bacterium]|nr:hypothetical protein [Chloroflexota bacterium]